MQFETVLNSLILLFSVHNIVSVGYSAGFSITKQIAEVNEIAYFLM